MRFSCEWLCQYVDLPEVEELARRLTAAGLNVELVESFGDDTVLDIDITTNRPDCMNHLGLAREVTVLFDRPLKKPAVDLPDREPELGVAAVRIEDAVGCPRYVGLVVQGVRVGLSPEWLTRRLEAVGLRPINNVVDVTNYVLWEYGQPLHAFDLDTLAEHEIRVRRAAAGETLVTLDGETRKLEPEVLVIADAHHAVALAGIMGGGATEVGDSTVNVLLESAHFDPAVVRRGAKKLDMRTDASHRFERGTDPAASLEAAARAAALITELAGGEVVGAIDCRAGDRQWALRGRLELTRVNAFAGVEIPSADVERWLQGLGFGVEAAGEGAWEVSVPTWRYYDFLPPKDGEQIWEADLYEEILRLWGFDRIPSALPAIGEPDRPPNSSHVGRDRIRNQLAASGFAEAINFAFHDPDSDRRYPTLVPELGAVPLANPLSERYSVMRRSLLPNLVDSARFNQRRGASAVRLFEVGHVFFQAADGGVEEFEALALVAGGHVGTPWDGQMEIDLFDLKGAIESLAQTFGVEFRARSGSLPALLQGTSADVLAGDRPVGYFGRLDVGGEPVDFPLFVAELDLRPLLVGESVRKVALPSRYPGVTADLTLTHALEVAWTELRRAIEENGPPELVSFGLKDRYHGHGVPEGAVNTTISFHYNAQDRSLTQEEVNEGQAALARVLEERFGWRG
jgi:phenylalanyl-tRNA synthetase beta chain